MPQPTDQLELALQRMLHSDALTKRVRVACLQCKQARRKCDLCRPCSGCMLRGLPCTDGGLECSACAFCSKSKLKCDKKRPCSRCVSHGRAEECLKGIGASLKLVGDAAESSRSVSASPEGAITVLGKRPRILLDPEVPMSFPDILLRPKPEPHPYACPQTDVQLPRSLYQLYAYWYLSPHYVQNLQKYSTPRLRSTLLNVFGLADRMIERARQRAPLAQAPPEQEEVGLNKPSWESSRCGLFSYSISVPQSAGGVPTVGACHANQRWVTLAGLHKEEFFARLFAQELPAFTTELRMLCRLLARMEGLVKFQMGMTPEEAFFDDEWVFGHFSRAWGVDRQQAGGVLTRMRLTKHRTRGAGGGWSSWSMVELTPEEYDTVAGRHPELCEALASEVLGPKTAAELLDPELDRRETLAHLSSTADGRAALDRLADAIHRRFAFFLSAMES